MIEKFGDYMYYLLHYPFKQAERAVNQWYIYLSVIGKLFDQNKEAFFVARREGCVFTASQIILPEHGLDRRLTRYLGEDIENFRNRILTYAETCSLGGTDLGVRLAVEALGFTNVETVACYKIDDSQKRWAEFYIVITKDMEDVFDVDHDIIRKVVDTNKKVSALPHYQFVFQMVAPEPEHIELVRVTVGCIARWYSNNSFDGLVKFDGGYSFNAIITNHPIQIGSITEAKHEESIKMTMTNKHHYSNFDGVYAFDGLRHFDAEIILEEI